MAFPPPKEERRELADALDVSAGCPPCRCCWSLRSRASRSGTPGPEEKDGRRSTAARCAVARPQEAGRPGEGTVSAAATA